MVEPVVIVHGGTGLVSEKLWAGRMEHVRAAARRGYEVLKAGGSAVDAAEAGVVLMEDCPLFNAGIGSYMTLDGELEMDALILDGTTMKAGGVGAIRNLINPIRVARLVMENSQHILLAGEGANKFAAAHGFHQVDPNVLITPYSKERLASAKEGKAIFTPPEKTDITEETEYGTVGCVVIDKDGHTASATSTGGLNGQIAGRVGDTPIIGAGGYADDQLGAVSTTGQGEAIMKSLLARHIIDVMATGQSVKDSIMHCVTQMEKRFNGYAGAIAVSPKGEIGIYHSAPQMAWAYVQAGKVHYGFHSDQHVTEEL